MTAHLKHLVEMVEIRGHNIGFCAELTKVIPNYNQIFPLIQNSVNRIKFSKSHFIMLHDQYTFGLFQGILKYVS